jgi:hypothetical protein
MIVNSFFMIDRNNEYKCKDIFTYKTSGNFVE